MAKSTADEWTTPENLILIEGWARDGLIDEQIAHNIGISRSTLSLWKKKHPGISDALKKGKQVVDREIENALKKSAEGYWVEETETFIDVKPDGTKSQRVKKNKKWIAANTTAQIFWLKNRAPDTWRDRRETQITGDVDIHQSALDIEKYIEQEIGADDNG